MTTAVATADRPAARHYRKTAMMRDVEIKANFKRGVTPTDEGYLELHDLFLDALRRHQNDRLAANSLDLFPPTFSHWLSRMGIEDEARSIRKQRVA